MNANKSSIAFIIHGLTVGGAERFFISLVNGLFARGYDLEVILLGDNNPLLPELNQGIRVTIFKRKHKYDLFLGSRIKKYLKEKKIETIFSNNTFPFFIVKLAYLFDRKTKFYLSLHSTRPRSRKEYLLNLSYFRLLNRMDTLLFISKIQGAYLTKKYHLDRAASFVVYNGIDTNYFCLPTSQQTYLDNKTHLKKEYSIPPDAKVILSTGRISEEKDHFQAIKALVILHKKYQTNAHLVYVGAGNQKYFDSVKQFVNDQNVVNFVHFAGQHKDVRPFFCLADIFTLTSFSETFSLAALEAMSSGLPCSLTDIGGAAEMINNETGLLSRSGDPESIAQTWDALLQKQIDPRILHDYVVANFSLDKMIEGYSQILF